MARTRDIRTNQLDVACDICGRTLLRGEHPEMNANILAAPGAPAVLGGPPYGNGVLIIILWANPNP